MQLGSQGRALIQFYEGLKLAPYNDVAGKATIGYGHLLHESPVSSADIVEYAHFTRDQAEALFDKDTTKVVNWINSHTPSSIKLSQGQFDALVSFAFNLGIGRLADSTLWRKICAGDMLGAELEFARWTMAGGVKVAGLVARRAAEAAIFAEGVIGGAVKKNVLPLLLAAAAAGYFFFFSRGRS